MFTWRYGASGSGRSGSTRADAALPDLCRSRSRERVSAIRAYGLRIGTTFAAPPLSTTLRKNVGATFHRSPASVMIVTVFLL